MRLKVQPLTAEAFAPFGQVISPPANEPTARPEGMEYWAGVAQLPDAGAAYDVGYATQAQRPWVQACAERHRYTAELLYAAGGDMVVVAGPPDYPDEPARLPAAERFVAFRVPEGQGVVFAPGVWHWAPFAVDATLKLVVIYRAGTASDDGVVADFRPEDVLEIEP